jgi:hypothetical protein
MLASMAPDEFATVAARVHAIAAYQTGDWRPGFPNVEIDEIRAQEGRNLRRFDIDFDLPDTFTPEFPPPIF